MKTLLGLAVLLVACILSATRIANGTNSIPPPIEVYFFESPPPPPCTYLDGGAASFAFHDGGTTLANANFIAYFWGPWWGADAGQQPAMNLPQQQLQTLATAPAFTNRLLEYGITPGATTYGGSLWCNHCVEDGTAGLATGQVATQLDSDPDVPDPTTTPSAANNVYVVFLPPTTFDKDDCTDLNECNNRAQRAGPHGGYHSWTLNKEVLYMVVEGAYELADAGASPVWPERTLHLSHEMAEVITDPYTDAWYDDKNRAEICDLCNKVAVNRTPPNVHVSPEILGIPVWQTWSNAACRCVTKRDVTLGDVTGGGLPTPVLVSPGSSDKVYTWSDYSGAISGWRFGSMGQIPFLLDITGEGPTNLQLYDPGTQLMYTAGYGAPMGIGEANAYNIPVPGDYDGDGIGDLAVWNTQSGNWYVRLSSQGGTVSKLFWPLSANQYGTVGIQGAQGDYDGDGKTDFAFFSPSTGWTISESYYGGSASGSSASGAGNWVSNPSTDISGYLIAGDVVTPGDFDGDGIADRAFYRQSTTAFAGTFFVQNSSNNVEYGVIFPLIVWPSLPFSPGDVFNIIPIVKDWDGDWRSDMALYAFNTTYPNRQALWGIVNTGNNTATAYRYGGPNDYPADWFVSSAYEPIVFTRKLTGVVPAAAPTPWEPSVFWATGLASALVALGFARLRRTSGRAAAS